MLTIQFSKYLNYNYFIINRKYVSDTLEHSKALWKPANKKSIVKWIIFMIVILGTSFEPPYLPVWRKMSLDLVIALNYGCIPWPCRNRYAGTY